MKAWIVVERSATREAYLVRDILIVCDWGLLSYDSCCKVYSSVASEMFVLKRRREGETSSSGTLEGRTTKPTGRKRKNKEGVGIVFDARVSICMCRPEPRDVLDLLKRWYLPIYFA